MTKVYLVKACLQIGSNSKTITLEAFTNKKLAKTYLEYKTLLRKQNRLKAVDYVSYELEELTISKLDWSEELSELQMKELPY